MKRTSGLLLISLLAACIYSASAISKDWEPPDYYHHHDGPIFQVLKEKDQTQQRRYDAGKWVATNITGITYSEAWDKGTKMLDDFWKGDNQQQAKVDKTTPKFVLLYPGQGKTLQSLFTVEYFLPHELHGNPPQPTTKELKVVDVEAYDVWVRTFGGYAREPDVINEVFGFIEDLTKQGIDVHTDVVGLAIYDDPSRLVNRHNEVWLWEKEAQPSLAALRNKMYAMVQAYLNRMRSALNRDAAAAA